MFNTQWSSSSSSSSSSVHTDNNMTNRQQHLQVIETEVSKTSFLNIFLHFLMYLTFRNFTLLIQRPATEAIKAKRSPTHSFSKEARQEKSQFVYSHYCSFRSFTLIVCTVNPIGGIMNVVQLSRLLTRRLHEDTQAQKSLGTDQLQQLNHHNSIRYLAAKLYLSTVQNWCFDCHRCGKVFGKDC